MHVLCEYHWYYLILFCLPDIYRIFCFTLLCALRRHSVCAGSVWAAIYHPSSTWCRRGGWMGGAGWGGCTAEHQQNWREGKTGRRCGGSTRGKQSGPSENHPQNNLYQNSFCQQILWRESPFRQKNLLMHFRAHINSTGALSAAHQQTHQSMLCLFVPCFVVLFWCPDLFLCVCLNLCLFVFS